MFLIQNKKSKRYVLGVEKKGNKTKINTVKEKKDAQVFFDWGKKEFKGFDTEDIAKSQGIQYIEDNKIDFNKYKVEIKPEPENIIEEDMLQGHYYPGHEMYD